MRNGWQVVVEVLLLRLLDDGLGYRWVRGPVSSQEEPDARAALLAGCVDGVCHSTSWRSDRPGRLVLTYAALPDPDPSQPAQPLGEAPVVAGGSPLRPTPLHVQDAHVAAHAVRHLADLARRDDCVHAAAQAEPELWSAIHRVAATTTMATAAG